MAATYHSPLQSYNTNGPASYRLYNGKRKSAVELLQETRALYVKSESVLEARVKPSPSGVENQTPSAVKPKSRTRGGKGGKSSTELQSKLRRLLNGDSSELSDVEPGDGGPWPKLPGSKSLPDLTRSPHSPGSPYSPTHPQRRRSIDRLPDSVSAQESSNSRRSSDSAESSGLSYGMPPSLSTVSLGGSASKIMRRNSSPEPVVPRSKSDYACLTTLASLTPLGTHSPLGTLTSLTSLPPASPPEPPEPPSPESPLPPETEAFFTYLGLELAQYTELVEGGRTSPPVYLMSSDESSSGSTTASEPGHRPSGEPDPDAEPDPPHPTTKDAQGLSIVERNARVIKWLVQLSNQ